MARRHDVAVVGGGFDGLVTAAYLARAGRSVVVLEPGERAGGTVATDELELPGGGSARAPAAFGTVEMLHPEVVRELGLGDHGLELVRGGGVLVPEGQEKALHLDPRQGSLGSQVAMASTNVDADSFREFERFHRRLAAALAPTLAEVLPPPAPDGLGGAWQLVQLAWRLRRLGADEMPEALRYLPMPIRDVLDERFESEPLKAVLAAPALTASWLAPRSAGSAYGLLHHRPAWIAGPVTPTVFVRGGPGRLAAALVAAVTAAGGTVRTGAAVERIAVSDQGARGVVLAGGEEVTAVAVASALHPRTTLLSLVEPRWLDPEAVRLVERMRGRGSVALVRFVVDRPPAIRGFPAAGAHLQGRIQLGGSPDELERAFDAAKYGRLPELPCGELTVPTALDPSLAPEGCHLVVAWVQPLPRTLAEAEWTSAGAELADRMTARIESAAPGFTDCIVHRDVVTPEDLERRCGVEDGCLYQLDMALDQLFHLRPAAGWYDHRTPVEGLWLCGPACHPGGGVTGLPGRNAARAILSG